MQGYKNVFCLKYEIHVTLKSNRMAVSEQVIQAIEEAQAGKKGGDNDDTGTLHTAHTAHVVQKSAEVIYKNDENEDETINTNSKIGKNKSKNIKL